MTTAAIERIVEGEIMPHEIVAYNPFRAQLAEMRAINEKTLFNYADPKGNKEARSYIYKLRQSKAALEKVRKEEKAASLEYGRKVDAEAKHIAEEIEAMIAVHQRPLDEIEERERQRVDAIKSRINLFIIRQECAGHSSEELNCSISEIKAITIDESFAEFQLEAVKAKDAALMAHEQELLIALKREAEQAELERLRKEAAEREQKEREERIAREAAERARLEAEEKARAEKEAIERKAREEREAAERRERELKEAAERAEKEKAQAIEAERQRVEREAVAKAQEDAKREADRKHQKAIHGDILSALSVLGISEETGQAVIIAIRKGEVPHIKIIY